VIYLVDSDWIIDFLKGKPASIQLFAKLAPEGIGISLISLGEVYDGIYGSNDPQSHEATFLRLLSWVPVIGLDEESVRRFARIRGELRKAGRAIGDFDILIAASAIRHDLVLVTRNIRHYERIAELTIYQDPIAIT
jgi:tRNA(fMet)-specific endonuclease VapC